MRQRPAQIRARTFLLRQVETLRAQGCNRLPVISILARQAAVSPASMWKAVQDLRMAGTLSVKPRAGITLTLPPGAVFDGTRYTELLAAPSRKPQYAWKRVHEHVGRAILDGTWEPQTVIPTIKEICALHGVAFRTARRALRALAREGLLEEFGRGFRVPAPARSAPSGTIVLLGPDDGAGKLLRLIPSRTNAMLRHVETYCALRKLSFHVAPVASDASLSEATRDLAAHAVVMGYLYWPMTTSVAQRAPLVQQLLDTAKPVAALNELRGIPVATGTNRDGRLRVFALATGSDAGRAVGAHLRALRHRQVAFVSPFHRSRWSRNRLAGLQEVYASAGDSGAVHVFAVNDWDSDKYAARHAPELSAVRRMLHACQSRTGTHGAQLLARLLQGLDTTAGECWSQYDLQPQFEQLVSLPSVTAVVAANDLSSYNFNTRGVVSAMLNHLLAPTNTRRLQTAQSVIEIPGYITVRRSSRRCVFNT